MAMKGASRLIDLLSVFDHKCKSSRSCAYFCKLIVAAVYTNHAIYLLMAFLVEKIYEKDSVQSKMESEIA